MTQINESFDLVSEFVVLTGLFGRSCEIQVKIHGNEEKRMMYFFNIFARVLMFVGFLQLTTVYERKIENGDNLNIQCDESCSNWVIEMRSAEFGVLLKERGRN
ncbi:uncharacterized protein LOC124450466 [Xenia sp. Carnegie-2017]|uniref:uncharacterized protein LOC124450466 n=1 Tax=Xenia sp. Carnegie-2017 TaxID=2897299 RepID=UPI001F03FFAC|nr:uncharacterized protein LOC124450466 [Xenia sp. Carnegie-2017]